MTSCFVHRAVDGVLQSMVERAVEDSVVLVGTPLGTPRATSSSSLDTVSGSVSGNAGELLRRFPALRAAVVAAATGALDAQRRESEKMVEAIVDMEACLLYTSPSPRDQRGSRMPSSA